MNRDKIRRVREAVNGERAARNELRYAYGADVDDARDNLMYAERETDKALRELEAE